MMSSDPGYCCSDDSDPKYSYEEESSSSLSLDSLLSPGSETLALSGRARLTLGPPDLSAGLDPDLGLALRLGTVSLLTLCCPLGTVSLLALFDSVIEVVIAVDGVGLPTPAEDGPPPLLLLAESPP